MLKNKVNNFYDLIKACSKEFGSNDFLSLTHQEDLSLTFQDTFELLGATKSFLDGHNLEVRSSIGVMLPNDISTALLFLHLPALNFIFVPINPKMSQKEIEYICRDAEISFVITLDGLKNNLPKDIKSVGIPLGRKWIQELSSCSPCEIDSINTIEPSDTAEIVYTSGTTGNPKGVELSHRNLISNSRGISESFDFSHRDKFLTITPLFHNSGQLFTTLSPMWSGSLSIPVRPEIALSSFWELVYKNNITWTLGMGSHINFLLEQKKDLSHQKTHCLKGILTGGMKLDEGKRKKFEKKFDTKVFITYGLTETTSFATCENIFDDNSPGSVGKPMNINEIKVISDANEKEGEIFIKGENVFERYHRLENLTKERKENGWLKTGDIGYFDEKGNLFITDRKDNMIIVSGENIYPAEIEQHSSLLEDIYEFIVIGIEHPIKGIEVAMIFTLKENRLKDINKWSKKLSSVLVNYKIPTRYIDVEELGFKELPKAPNGKILRSKLNQIIKDYNEPDK